MRRGEEGNEPEGRKGGDPSLGRKHYERLCQGDRGLKGSKKV